MRGILKTAFIAFFLLLAFIFECNIIFSKEQAKLYGVTGTILEINSKEGFLTIKTKGKKEEIKKILITPKTKFTKALQNANLKDFKVEEVVTVSTPTPLTANELEANTIFDQESAFFLATGQMTVYEYNGKIREIKGNIVEIGTTDGQIKKLYIYPTTTLRKAQKNVKLQDFKTGDEVFAEVKFRGTPKYEPKEVPATYLFDGVSYVMYLMENRYGPPLVEGKVDAVDVKRGLLLIGKEKVQVNKFTTLHIPLTLKGIEELKGRDIIVYSATRPIPGRTIIAAGILDKEAIPQIIQGLIMSKKEALKREHRIIEGEVFSLNISDNSIVVVKDNKQKKITLTPNTKIVDKSNTKILDLPIEYLRQGDKVFVDGYSETQPTYIIITSKAESVVPRIDFTLRVLFFTDFQGFLEPTITNAIYLGLTKETTPADFLDFSPVEAGGAGYLAYEISKLRTPNTLVVSSGDFSYGTPVANLTKGKAVVDVFNKIGLDAVVLGKGEFYYGKEGLKELIKRANFPVLGANVVEKGTDTLLEGVKPYIIKEIAGKRVGILGIITPEISNKVPSEFMEGMEILPIDAALNRFYGKMLAEGVDVVILLANQRAYDNRLLIENFIANYPQFEVLPTLVISGDVHSFIALPEPIKTEISLISEAGTKGRYLGDITLNYHAAMSKFSYVPLFHPIGPGFIKEEDVEVANLVKSYKQILPPEYNEVVGETIVPLARARNKESNFGNLVADALKTAGSASLGIYFSNGLREDLSPGKITNEDIFKAIPYDYKLAVVEMPGKAIKEVLSLSLDRGEDILQVSGIKIVYHKKDKNIEILLDNKELEDNSLYKVATCDYLTEGKEGYTTFTSYKPANVGETVRKIVTDYIKSKSPINIGVEGRIKIVR